MSLKQFPPVLASEYRMIMRLVNGATLWLMGVAAIGVIGDLSGWWQIGIIQPAWLVWFMLHVGVAAFIVCRHRFGLLGRFPELLAESGDMLCPTCGYSLRDRPDEDVCPECGEGYDRKLVVLMWRAWRSARPTWRFLLTPFCLGMIVVATCVGGFLLARGAIFTAAMTSGASLALLVGHWVMLVNGLAHRLPPWKLRN